MWLSDRMLIHYAGFDPQHCNLESQAWWVHSYNPCTQEVEAGGLRVQSQLGLHSKTLSQKNKKQKQTKLMEIIKSSL
jgi:hypothetical protein